MKNEIEMTNRGPQLSPEAIAARREYLRAWRRKNADRIREYNRRRWEKVAEKMKQAEGGGV